MIVQTTVQLRRNAVHEAAAFNLLLSHLRDFFTRKLRAHFPNPLANLLPLP